MIKRLFVVFLFTFVACSSRHTTQNLPKEDPFDRYVVQREGESLPSIAHKYTGSALNWKELAELNPNLKSFRLKKGEEILVPKGYLDKKKNFSNQLVVKEKKDIKEEKVNESLRENLSSTVLIENNSNNETIKFVSKDGEIVREEPEVYVPYPEGKKYKRLRDDIINEFIADEE